METITLQQVLPAVFSDRPPQDSGIWLREVSFRKGECTLLEAESGSGKSSLCSYLYGYRTDYAGTILFDGRDCRQFSPKEWSRLRNRSLSMMFQELRLFPELSVLENIRLKNDLAGGYQSPNRINRMLEQLGIADKRNTMAGRLSFGQQQRVAFIRSLCQPFDFILLDEPVSHLDDANSAVLAQLLSEEVSRQGAGIVVTSIGRRINIPYDKILSL